jgi:nitrogen-specific signal transduction histidine kinase
VAPEDLSGLFHQLNNQLGVILANAELLERRLSDDHRARAAQLVVSAVDAIATSQRIRRLAEAARSGTQ